MEIVDKLNKEQISNLMDIYKMFFREIDFDNKYNDKIYESLSNRMTRLAKINQGINKKFYFVVDDENVIGFIYGRIVDSIGLICNVYVTKENRNTFVHTNLIKEIIEWFKCNGVETIEIEVHKENPILKSIASKNWNLLEAKEPYNVFQRKI